ncbi:MAG: diguanylate cyclase [Meiothermus sp.]|nr:diguanylate cyclase [Meiothermus sp.]
MNAVVADLETQLSQSTSHPQRLGVLHRLYLTLCKTDLLRAREVAQTAVLEFSPQLEPLQKAVAWLDWGDCHLRLGELEQAREIMNGALRLSRGASYALGEAQALGALAQIAQAQNDLPQALEYRQSALGILAQIKTGPLVIHDPLSFGMQVRSLEASLVEGIAAAQEAFGNYPEAAKYALRGLNLRRELADHAEQSQGLTLLGRLYLEMGEYGGAIRVYEESLELAQRGGNASAEAGALLNLGTAYSRLGRHDQALVRQQEALNLAQARGLQGLQAKALEQLGQTQVILGNPTQALEWLRRGRQLYRQLGSRVGEGRVLLQLGLALQQLGELSEAVETLQQAQGAAEGLGLRQLKLEAHQALSRVYESAFNPAEALRHLRIAVELERTQFQERQSAQTSSLLSSFALEQARQQSEDANQRNLELAAVIEQLEQANERLRESDVDKSRLLEELRSRSAELERLARQDSLTRLNNRRYLEEHLAREFAASRRYRYPLTVALMDIDHFKQINDRFSHPVGDDVLRVVAVILAAGCRGTDFAARYGGEEFALVLTQTDPAGAWTACERIRQQIEGYAWADLHPGLTVTVSFGLCGDPDLAHHEKLLAVADAELYAAKRAGRNRVHPLPH